MVLTELHAELLAEAFQNVLGQKPDRGDMAFVRCLRPNVVEALAEVHKIFAPEGWHVWRVADSIDSTTRTITADRAVELREAKNQAVLLLVDTSRAGAGMDGIYSAAREVDEASLFNEAVGLASTEVTHRLSRQTRSQAESAVKKARGFGRRYSVSPWTEFDFLVRIAAEQRQPGELLYLIGLWPAKQDDGEDLEASLDVSRLFVNRLLGIDVAGIPPSQRIKSLKLLNPSDRQIIDLESFLQVAASKPFLPALADLAVLPSLWVNALQVEGAAEAIIGIDLIPWRTRTGRIAKWSGLIDSPDDEAPPVFIMNSDALNTGDYSKLEVRWRSRPDNLAKGAADYHVAILTDMDEEITSREVRHTAKREERCRFTNDDFSLISDDALISAKMVVSVVGNEKVAPQESEEFTIRFGTPPEHTPAGVGKKIRTFSEGLIELENRPSVTALASETEHLPEDAKGYMVLRSPQRGKSYRVFRPPLIREVEQQWAVRSGAIGRWRVRVRASGALATEPEFIHLADPGAVEGSSRQSLWGRASNASRKMAERVATGSGVGQIYDDQAKGFDTVVKEYMLAWAALLEDGDPLLVLANTVEIQTLSGETIGLIVLPTHPLRVAWHVAYDNLVFHTAFDQGASPKEIREEFALLDGAMFPAFLPGLEDGGAFVFADTLGFHTVGMVPDDDKEPKAAVAILARALGESETADTVPTVGKQSAQVLGDEILKYLDCHHTTKLLHIHALRPGDGYTVARALGRVQEQRWAASSDTDPDESENKSSPAFVLELYPSTKQRGLAGRFIAEIREKRRSGAGTVAAEDRWMLESLALPGGINLPKLRWARKTDQVPKTAAHVAVAFDTFESRVAVDESNLSERLSRPLYAYGLLSFFERDFSSTPFPLWRSIVLASADGEKHPSDRTHTERLIRMQQAVERCVAQSIGGENQTPTLKTEISPEKAHSLRELHRRCDWVITLDRNGGIEYFDSPRDNKEVYDVFVIDTVPEREDLGCLQLITSTSNLAEVRNLLDAALDQMGLSHSRRNAEFLMDHLKALSGRLAIRLTGQKAATSELIALALSHANCYAGHQGDACWTPLESGYLIPVDDVQDLIPPLSARKDEEETGFLVSNARPDLIYVSVIPRKGLSFQFIEVKYRRHLRVSRSPELLKGIHHQVQSLRKRWEEWYSGEDTTPTFRALRRAKLARVLRFYADKAHRHHLPKEQYRDIVAEIDRMIEKGVEYSFAASASADRGWVFCPEFAGFKPLLISPPGWDTEVFLFGPGLLPDSVLARESLGPSTVIELDSRMGSAKASATEDEQPIEIFEAPEQSDIDANQSPTIQPEPDKGSLIEPVLGSETSKSREETKDSSRLPVDTAGSDHIILLGEDLLTRSEVRWPIRIKGNPHLLLAGLPGMGKTTCLVNICRQMLDGGIRPIVFSYHEDIDERLEAFHTGVRYIDFRGLGFNPLKVINRTSPMAYLDMAGALRDIFTAIYPELGDIQGERIRKAIKDSFVEKGWDDPDTNMAELVEPQFGRFLEILRSNPKPDQGLRMLLARLDELDDYGLFNPTESQVNLWESDQPIVIRIHTTQNDNLQKAFASLVLYGLYKDMFRRGVQRHITHAIVFDEAHRAAKLHLIPTMAKECRKYGISFVLASQEARDFNVSVFSAIANYLVLRLNETDAKTLVRNVASSDQERMLVDKIKQMERFKALCFLEGRKNPALVSLMP